MSKSTRFLFVYYNLNLYIPACSQTPKLLSAYHLQTIFNIIHVPYCVTYFSYFYFFFFFFSFSFFLYFFSFFFALSIFLVC
ncbi:hypothetical protein F4810DRAFT_687233 [Camillea tinctor]|nr:hypothetical protein F4810DRAFT_687233 [Camillea tinctor]